MQDDIYEANIGAETFAANISAISAVGCSISAGPNRTATVSITDNEGMLKSLENCVVIEQMECLVTVANGSLGMIYAPFVNFMYPTLLLTRYGGYGNVFPLQILLSSSIQ